MFNLFVGVLSFRCYRNAVFASLHTKFPIECDVDQVYRHLSLSCDVILKPSRVWDGFAA